MMVGLVLLLLAVLAAGCGGPAGSDSGSPGNAEEPPAEDDEGIARHDTREGEAAIQLVVEPREISLGETVTIRLINRGDVQLLTGPMFNVERWDREGWVNVPWPENTAFPDVGIILRPGGSTDPQRWPDERVHAEPGWYRAMKSASYEDPEHARPDTKLEARTRFHLRAKG